MTTAWLATAIGRGAIAVVVVDGPDALAAVDALVRLASGAPLAVERDGAVRFGVWRPHTQGSAGEEVVVVRVSTRRVEVHSHGGVAASEAILVSLAAGGVQRAAAPSEAPAGATALGAAAWRLLPAATTERAAAVLLDQAAGAFDTALHAALAEIARGETSAAELRLTQLLDRAPIGQRLARPWRVVLAGPPNAGKSSIANALLGHARSIVHDSPGTTRDVLTAATALAGWPVVLADTAGLREAADPVEAAGVELARSAARSAEVLVVVQPAPGWTDAEADTLRGVLALAAEEAAVVLVASKADLAAPDELAAAERAGAVATTALRPGGVAALVEVISRAIEPDPLPRGAAVPFDPGHSELLLRARGALRAGDPAAAKAALRAVLASGSIAPIG